MATRKQGAAATPAQGNEFTFYMPLTAGTSGKPVPPPAVKVAGSKRAQPTPKAFIDSAFVKTSKAGFGTQASLGGPHHLIQRIELVRAALEGGYGRRSNWNPALVLNTAQALDLTSYLLHRLQMVTACLTRNGQQAHALRTFYDRIEASEKTALSFVLGGMGAYLAARQWLAAGGDRLRSFLHVGIYTKGIAGGVPAASFASGGQKTPDYLVEGHSGTWHVFESKGGHHTGRWARLCQGLAQLAHVPQIAWAGQTPATALTCVCVHTSVDPGAAIRVTAVDPPAEGDDRPPLVLVEGVCRLLLMLETIEQYRAMATTPLTGDDGPAVATWQLAHSAWFGEGQIGIPRRYLQREEEVRRRLAVFLAIGEMLDGCRGTSAAVDWFDSAVRAHLERARSNEGVQPELDTFNGGELAQTLRELAPHALEPDFAWRCSKALRLETLADELMGPSQLDTDLAGLRLTADQPYVVTSGGMLLSGTAEAKASGG